MKVGVDSGRGVGYETAKSETNGDVNQRGSDKGELGRWSIKAMGHTKTDVLA